MESTHGLINSSVRKEFLKVQKIYRLVSSEKFKLLCSILNDEEKKELEKTVLKFDIKEIKAFIKQHEKKDLELMDISQLRELGRKLKVKFYYNLPKESLIEEIKYARDSVESFQRNEGFGSQSKSKA